MLIKPCTGLPHDSRVKMTLESSLIKPCKRTRTRLDKHSFQSHIMYLMIQESKEPLSDVTF